MIGVLKFTPEQFYNMTPGDINTALEGWNEQYKADLGVMVWAVAHLISPYVKRKMGLIKRLRNALFKSEQSTDIQDMLPGEKEDKLKTFFENMKLRRKRRKKNG